MNRHRSGPDDVDFVNRPVDRHPSSAAQSVHLRLGTVAAGVALGVSSLYVIMTPLSATFHLGLSDRSGFGPWLFDLIWFSLAFAVVGGTWRLRSASRSIPVLDAGADCDQPRADGAAPGMPPVSKRGRPARNRRLPVPEALGFLWVLAVYHGVFLPGAITWGDWKYWVTKSSLLHFFPLPSLWSFSNLGTQNILGLPLAPVEELIGLMARVGMSYSVSERMLFYFPMVLLPYLGVVMLLRAIGARPVASALGGLLFATNTYALGLIAGGWGTVGVGYGLAPWVALAGLQLYRRGGLARAVVVGLLVGIQAWYDPREALLSCMAGGVIVVVLIALRGHRAFGRARARDLVTAGSTVALSQLHWLLVALFAILPALPSGYTSVSWLQVLSYQSLGDGLAIFRPFWPFEVFPGTPLHVVPAVWMAVPMIAALALLRRPASATALLAGAVYLVFAALVSGATAPFALLNSWLFKLPGLDVFRDPSPYFGPAALAAAVLVGVCLNRSTSTPPDSAPPPRSVLLPEARSDGLSRYSILQGGVVLMLAGMLAVGAFPAVSARLGENLAPKRVPSYDLALAHYLDHNASGAVLWLPGTGQFLIRSRDNPSISGWDLAATSGVYFPPFPSVAPFYSLSWLSSPAVVAQVLQRYGVRYVVLDTSPASYQLRSLPYGDTVGMEQEAFAGLSHRSFGPLAVYRLHSAPGAPFSLVGAGQVVVRQPTDLQQQLSEFPVSVAASRRSAASVVTSRAFSTELRSGVAGAPHGNPRDRSNAYLSVAEPVQHYSVVEAELRGSSILLRDVPTVASVEAGRHVLAEAPPVPWQIAGVLSGSEVRRGIVIGVDGTTHYLSWSVLAGAQPVLVATVPTNGSSLIVTLFRLGSNLLGVQSFQRGLGGWGSLGNENNWQHFHTLRSAGITATPGGSCGSGALTLTARLDVAGIDHAVPFVAGDSLVIGAQLRRLEGSEPVMNGVFQGGQVLPFPERTGRGQWASISSIVSGHLNGLQFEVFQGQHGRSVACLRDPYAREAVAIGTTMLAAHVSIALLPLASAGFGDPVTYQPPPGLAETLQLLPTTSFGTGLGAWGSLGNENNYNHDTLRAAGISASVTRLGGEPVLHLTVRSGAAGIDQPYVSWAASNVYRLSLTYRTSAGASLTASFFPRTGYPAAQTLGFASSGRRWVTKTMEFYMQGTASSPATLPGTVELALWPKGGTNSESAYISHISLQQVIPQPVIVEEPSQPPGTHGSGYVTPKWFATPAGGDSLTVSVGPHRHAELLVFWQSYSTAWKAVDSTGNVLTHVKVNGWANGYLLEGAETSSHIQVGYQPQQWEVLGLLVEFAALLLATGALVIFAFRSMVRRKRLGADQRNITGTSGRGGGSAGRGEAP